MQAALTLHPRSPWRDATGKRTPFDADLDAYFESLLEQHGLDDDRNVRRAVEAGVRDNDDPRFYSWPVTRRGRAQARITLRRLAQGLGEDKLAPWKALYDRVPVEDDESEQRN
jgi:hypothetical protein